jgi:hypothetical protein
MRKMPTERPAIRVVDDGSRSDGFPIANQASTFVYSSGVEETYRFDEDSYQRLEAARIGWQSVLDVLQARPRWRQHIGAVLRIAAPDRAGRWLGVALIEEDDDQYLVVGARELDAAESETVRRLLEQGGS